MGGGFLRASASGQRCGALALQPGSISGVAEDSSTRQPITAAVVTCWDNSLAARVALKNPARYTAVAGPRVNISYRACRWGSTNASPRKAGRHSRWWRAPARSPRSISLSVSVTVAE